MLRRRTGAGRTGRLRAVTRRRRTAPESSPRARRVGRDREETVAVLEGVQLAEHAVRFRLKNEILVDVLRDGRAFDADRYALRARTLLGRLAAEAEAAAIRMIDERGAAELAGGAKRHEHDYRVDDLGNLHRREQVYRAVARSLRGAMTERDRMRGHALDAREHAWDEIARNIERRVAVDAQRRTLSGAERGQAIARLAADLAALVHGGRPD